MPAIFYRGRRGGTDARVEDKLIEVAREDRRRGNVWSSASCRVGKIHFFFTGRSCQLGRDDGCPAFISKRCDGACITTLRPERDLVGSADRRGRGRGGRCGRTSRGRYGDIIGKRTVIIDCSGKILCEPPVVIDDELDVVRARQEWDGCGKGVGVRWAVVRLGL
jgi:hypothetical protein